MSTVTRPDGARAPRSPLTERRKAETRRTIARAACELFAERGAAGTTAEEIAAAAGVGLRTFYRYFRYKEDAVEPVLAEGANRWLDLVAAGPPGLPDAAALESVAVRALAPDDAEGVEAMERTGGLLRAASADPALEAVWARVNLAAERRLAAVLTGLAPDADPLRIRTLSAGAAAAIRTAIEHWSAAPDRPVSGPGSPSALVSTAMRALTGGTDR
ncbi:TetR family transcriptional regulator [Nocardiopsis potens]|uniref:TetR family transcriptional regulator n=1 Tax=Nocardiopsis potens TaxID=1246458 RepID=UPI00034D33D6|nr:TetR family transcriptional regulator [Nocardiopsis potens]